MTESKNHAITSHDNNKNGKRPVSSSSKTIPLIDFSPFLDKNKGVLCGSPPTAAQLEVAQAIDKVCRAHGFLALVNFGITADERNQAFAESRQLFALPEKVKLEQLQRITPATNTGYCPFLSENINRSRPAELKEAFNLRFPPHHVNPLQGCPPSLGTFFENVFLPKYRQLAHAYALACAVALKIPDTEFCARTLQRYDLCTLRLLHYPPCQEWYNDDNQNADLADVSKPLRIGEHTDFGAFTFLMVDPAHGPDGLQIKPVTGGEVGGAAAGEADGWQDVVLPATHKDEEPVLIVNTGALMARWTNDEWKATAHRVVVTDAAAAARARYSMACFCDPDADSLIQVHESFATQGREIQYPPIKSSDYLLQKLQSMMKKE